MGLCEATPASDANENGGYPKHGENINAHNNSFYNLPEVYPLGCDLHIYMNVSYFDRLSSVYSL